MKYDPRKIEKKWQEQWAKKNFAAWQAKDSVKKEKKYVLDMFPYPSGEGLHVGHVEGYTATDIYSRWLRMRGFNVLHPMGWDAFGLPAENYAIKTKTHPAVTVAKNVERFKKQLQSLGFSYDWSRELNTTDPNYYKWTQWIFLQFFKHGLAYEAEVAINWCPSCKTGLSNEEVVDGKCERCGSKVERKFLRQWLLKITAYAERLLEDLKELDWPEHVKEMQRNWIGRSEGHEIEFRVAGREDKIKVFTTRADTLFGATYMVLAPEHPLVSKITGLNERDRVAQYVAETSKRSELERTSLEKEKTGVFIGAHVLNPATYERIPIWISDYVLLSYGTGAIMAVPAHDERDFEFARRFNLPIKEVVSPDGLQHKNMDKPFVGEGIMVNSGPFDRADSRAAREKISQYVGAKPAVNYKLRDWIFSRQRYWGEPIPLVFCEACKKRIEKSGGQDLGSEFSAGELLNPGWVAVSEKNLPVKLPDVKSYEPTGTGESPLAGISSWVNAKCPHCGGPAKRETNTMPQWAGSCWYYLGYILGIQNSKIKIQKSFWDQKKLKYWLPVDTYVGGVEHAVLHLLYARFWHKFLYDLKIVPTKEPFQKLVNQGLILGPDGEKMSKSRGNVVNPDEMIKKYGADSLRLYEMFMGPLEQMKPWDPQGIIGMFRFLNRVWMLVFNFEKRKEAEKKKTLRLRSGQGKKTKNVKDSKEIERLVHKTIKKVTDDLVALRFNTAISGMMELQNALSFRAEKIPAQELRSALENFVLLLSPFAPHISEELWQMLAVKKARSMQAAQAWPKYDPKLIIEESVTYAIQVNGKLRDTMKVKIGLAEEEAVKLAKARTNVAKWIHGKKITRVIFVQNKLVNFVVN